MLCKRWGLVSAGPLVSDAGGSGHVFVPSPGSGEMCVPHPHRSSSRALSEAVLLRLSLLGWLGTHVPGAVDGQRQRVGPVL